jgi:lysophospholipase L1-like esterase
MLKNFRASRSGRHWLCGLFFLAAAPAAAEVSIPCGAPAEFNRLDQPLARTSQRLLSGQPLTIVAIGSSSTAGAGASSSAASYPSRLEVELKQRFTAATIKVLNRGVNGEEAADMIARFDKAVLAEQPDLVLWQVGTNSVLRDGSIETTGSLIRQGLARLKAGGADVVLIDPQFAPKVVVKPEAEAMVQLIATTAKAINVPVFHRFAIMRHWQQSERVAFDQFLSSDGLHLNDWSYGCWAKLLAGAIAEAATRATTVAGGAPATTAAIREQAGR